ncbi:MAG: CHAP domain-containing protein [Rhodospirillales bacterium]|nr:CHAP domain-containing protein [Rhodospirillales bacterium]
MSCVPFARADSGIDLAGNAWQWWGHAAGKYARGSVPQRGAVLNFRAIGRMRLGHVAVVARVINRREITVDQANWPGPGSWGNITRNVPVVDVSPNNDWTAVRVGLGRPGSFGSVYPTYGFIYDHPDRGEPMLASAEPPAPTPRLGPAPHDLRSPAERIAASRARYNEVAEAPAIAAPDNGHDLAVGSSLRLDAPDRSLR